MTIPKPTLDTEERPTLPSIHTLNLPSLSRPKQTYVKYQNHHDNLVRILLYIPFFPRLTFFIPSLHTQQLFSPLNHHGRQVSTSSSHTSASHTISRSPSPSLSDSDPEKINKPSIPHNNRGNTKFRLVPCSLDIADAVILVVPSSSSSSTDVYPPNLPNYVPRTGHGRGLLLVGPALQQIRQPSQRQLAKGARIHPYRVVRGENNTTTTTTTTTQQTQNSRRSSIISITSFSHVV